MQLMAGFNAAISACEKGSDASGAPGKHRFTPGLRWHKGLRKADNSREISKKYQKLMIVWLSHLNPFDIMWYHLIYLITGLSTPCINRFASAGRNWLQALQLFAHTGSHAGWGIACYRTIWCMFFVERLRSVERERESKRNEQLFGFIIIIAIGTQWNHEDCLAQLTKSHLVIRAASSHGHTGSFR